MARRWLSKNVAVYVPANNPSPMTGSARRGITIHDEGVTRKCDGGPHVVNLAKYVRSKGIYYHLIYCDRCGKWAQIIPLDKAAKSMKGGDVDGRGNSANRAGTVNVQICLAGRNASGGGPKPDWAKAKNLWVLAQIEQAWKIPRKVRKDSSRDRARWMKGGVAGHRNGPRDDHRDPGNINMGRMMRQARKQWRKRRKA